MAEYQPVHPSEIYMGRLAHGADLLEELTRIVVERGIRLGRIEAIGAVQRARIGFYDQETRAYLYNDLDYPLEITLLSGNISIKEGQPFVHAHVTLADEAGRAVGGHLAAGTIVFACEFMIQAFEGPVFERRLDETTGLPLWSGWR